MDVKPTNANIATPDYLSPSPRVDADHPDIVRTMQRLTVGATSDVDRAVRLHDFVRDEILFGWVSEFDEQKASQVLASGIGFCNTQSTLMTALLRAAGIPTRIHFATINRKLLEGLIRPPATFIDHSYVDIMLDGGWVSTDSYVVDPGLHRAAVARCGVEGRRVGYGVHVAGSTVWDGRTSNFTQFLDDGTVADLSDADFGGFRDLDEFRASGLSRNSTRLPARLLIRWLTKGANGRVAQLRRSPSQGEDVD